MSESAFRRFEGQVWAPGSRGLQEASEGAASEPFLLLKSTAVGRAPAGHGTDRH